MLFFMLCWKYVYMQTHVLLTSKNKDDKSLGNGEKTNDGEENKEKLESRQN